MTNKQSCKRCGAPMEGGAALQGMCTRCLMELGMEADYIAVGEYKSAPETFTRRGPSDPARKVQESLLDDVYGQVVGHIAQGRGKTKAEVRRWFDEAPYTTEQAKEMNRYEQLAGGRSWATPRSRVQY